MVNPLNLEYFPVPSSRVEFEMSIYKKTIISVFILMNFMFMIKVHVPNTYFFQTVYKPINPILTFFSLHQSWAMFSPDPSRINSYVTAEVEFEDGDKGIYQFPKSSELPMWDRFVYGERFRVFSENLRQDKNSFLWKDASKFALRNLKSEYFFKIPLRVNLYRHWDIIPEPKKEFRPHLASVKKYNKHKFYTYEVFQ